MKKEEFLKIIKEETDNFDEFWKLNHKENPDSFPNENGFSDWFEQFTIYLELEK